MDRRQLLISSLLAGVTVACANEGESKPATSGRPSDSNADGGPVTAAKTEALGAGRSRVPLGVASGDPLADRVMLWTRVFPADANSTEVIEVAFDVATDDQFNDLVISEIAKTTPDLAYSAHVDVTGLKPDTWYYYRFRRGSDEFNGPHADLPDSGCREVQLRLRLSGLPVQGYYRSLGECRSAGSGRDRVPRRLHLRDDARPRRTSQVRTGVTGRSE
ncbi:MAG: PhoD-like phosphatase N-terminal domain-containing protein [Microthrixaceae bacterium]